MNRSLTLLLESAYSNLSKSHRKIADFINKNLQYVAYANISKLAESVDVGEATIVRFCQKIGFNGYSELREFIRDELISAKKDTVYFHANQHEQGTTFLNVAEQLHQLNIESINDTLALLNESVLIHIVDLLKESKNIYFYGLGLSGLIAVEGKFKLMRIGMRADACTDEHTLLINSSLVSENDLIIAVSNSGETEVLNKSVCTAKSNGAKIIVITKYSQSHLTHYADAVLLNSGLDKGLEIGSSTVKASQTFLIDLIYNAFLYDRMDHGNEISLLQATKKAFDRK